MEVSPGPSSSSPPGGGGGGGGAGGGARGPMIPGLPAEFNVFLQNHGMGAGAAAVGIGHGSPLTFPPMDKLHQALAMGGKPPEKALPPLPSFSSMTSRPPAPSSSSSSTSSSPSPSSPPNPVHQSHSPHQPLSINPPGAFSAGPLKQDLNNTSPKLPPLSMPTKMELSPRIVNSQNMPPSPSPRIGSTNLPLHTASRIKEETPPASASSSDSMRGRSPSPGPGPTSSPSFVPPVLPAPSTSVAAAAALAVQQQMSAVAAAGMAAAGAGAPPSPLNMAAAAGDPMGMYSMWGMMQMKNSAGAGAAILPPAMNMQEPHESSSSAIARAVAISHQSQRRPRSEKKPIPAELKDQKYFERRKRNNMAAKKSRDMRKSREDEIAIRASFLEKENAILRAQVATLREEANSLRQLLLQKRSRTS